MLLAQISLSGTRPWDYDAIQVPNPSICDAVRSGGKPVVVAVTGQTVTFDGGAAETVRVPDGIITFSTDASTTPATATDSAGAWQVWRVETRVLARKALGFGVRAVGH